MCKNIINFRDAGVTSMNVKKNIEADFKEEKRRKRKKRQRRRKRRRNE